MLRFDNLGLGDSKRDWGDGSFSHKVADTVRAAEFMNASASRTFFAVQVVVGADGMITHRGIPSGSSTH
jgi:hypothetical protein